MSGKAYLVGAGPGHPDLITVKGLRLIRAADVILYDRLIPQELLREARADAELIFVGKRPDHHPLPQPEITRLLLEKVAAGHQVVRLKGGDPFVFGRGGEEALALANADLPFEIVPGISSAVAAPAYGGVPLTQKGVAAAFGIVAGHETPDKPTSTTDWAAMAQLPTLVVLMGMRRLPFVVKALLDEGKSAETPAAIVSHATTMTQQSLVGTLGNLIELARQNKIPTPAVTIIGDVARFHDSFAWFQNSGMGQGFVDSAELPPIRHKVRTYVTHQKKLLVFRQPNAPEAGLQVPGGTVEAGESLLAAALREATEESGLAQLRVVRSLGQRRWRFERVILDTHYVHLAVDGPVADTWQHWETQASDQSGPHLFEFFWVDFADIPDLVAKYPHFFWLAAAVI